MQRKYLHSLMAAVWLSSAGSGWAQDAGSPLPRCEGRSQVFYLARYESVSPAYPKATLFQVALNADFTASTTEIWSGQGDPSSSVLPALTGNPGASVAIGMNPKDGYIYAMRALGSDGSLPKEARTEVFKYGATGVKNLGQLDLSDLNLVEQTDFQTLLTKLKQAGGNFTAADFDPDGNFYIASFQGVGDLQKVFKVDVTTTPPKLTKVINLSGPIPGGSSGDFTIAADGWAYGITPTGTNQQAYRFNVANGNVESLGSPYVGGVSFGSAAQLADGSMAQFSSRDLSDPDVTNRNLGHIWLMQQSGSLSAGPYLMDIGNFSSDGANCLPKPKAPPSGVTPVPTLSAWGLSLLGVLMAAFAFVRRRRES